MNKELDRELALALVLGLGGAIEGTWMEHDAAQEIQEKQKMRQWRFEIVWEDSR